MVKESRGTMSCRSCASRRRITWWRRLAVEAGDPTRLQRRRRMARGWDRWEIILDVMKKRMVVVVGYSEE
ncbi:hypothetical protein HA466_0104140 [Hirschfeldia incana]|nr:hypothetical protein HA466_0104140 [Hirschfeldia incana]